MPRSRGPRKPYRPRAIGRPVLARMRDELILPCHIALQVLERSNDAEALESARHTLAAALDYMLVALGRSDRDTKPIRWGLDVLQAVIDRHQRVGKYRATGPELVALRAAIVHSDEQLPYLRTDQLIDALRTVDRIMARLEETPA